MSNIESVNLFSDLCTIVETTKRKTAVAVNSGIVFMYWNIGHRINTEVLGNKRAEYGKQIVSTLSTQLNEHFETKEFSTRNLHRMMQFAADFQDVEIVSTLATQLNEHLQLDQSGIRVAQYLTEFPSKELLQKHLRHHIENDSDECADSDF